MELLDIIDVGLGQVLCEVRKQLKGIPAVKKISEQP